MGKLVKSNRNEIELTFVCTKLLLYFLVYQSLQQTPSSQNKTKKEKLKKKREKKTWKTLYNNGYLAKCVTIHRENAKN